MIIPIKIDCGRLDSYSMKSGTENFDHSNKPLSEFGLLELSNIFAAALHLTDQTSLIECSKMVRERRFRLRLCLTWRFAFVSFLEAGERDSQRQEA